MVHLEWQLFPTLGFDSDAPTLHSALADDPDFFAELVGHVYRSEEDEHPEEEEDPRGRALGRRAYEVLRAWRHCPGAGPDNMPERAVLQSWIERARARLAEMDRTGAGDREIGQALAWAAPDEDGTFPPKVVRDLIEAIRSDRLDAGIAMGIRNKRGITTRDPHDGGTQERELASQYRTASDAAVKWPRTRRLLRALADDYDRDASYEDERAERARRGLNR